MNQMIVMTPDDIKSINKATGKIVGPDSTNGFGLPGLVEGLVDQMALSPQTQAKTTVAALMREARAAGWLRARFEIKPDGTTVIDASMVDPDAADDFLNSDLRMGK